MEIAVIDKQKLLSASALRQAEARVNASFARFGDNINSVRIAVYDANGPRGGKTDKECRVLVRLRKTKEISVTARDDSLSKAITAAINRSARSVGRMFDRRSIREGIGISPFSFDRRRGLA